MKGYWISTGYMGWDPIDKVYILFPTEKEYEEYYRYLIGD